MNEIFIALGLERMKPLATAALLPPMPFLILVTLGLGLSRKRRSAGHAVAWVGLAMVWASGCLGVAQAIAPRLLALPKALSAEQISELARHNREPVAIIALGSGLEPFAPEYGGASLQYRSLERLRYAMWLGQRTGWPVGFSGGVGWGQSQNTPSASEAVVAEHIASSEYGHPLRWVEGASRDTRENAANTVAMLRRDNVKRIVLVTHAWHMARSIRNFQRAARAEGLALQIDPAPIGLAVDTELEWLRWVPSGSGFTLTATVVREWLCMLGGA